MELKIILEPIPYNLKDFLEDNNIHFEEWTADNDGYEVRIDVGSLNDKKSKILAKFLERENLSDIAYVIFY